MQSKIFVYLWLELHGADCNVLWNQNSGSYVSYQSFRILSIKIYSFRPDILKHEMKVFFVKYNDPIYVKLEKLDIMIRLTNQANIAQVLAELKE